MTKLGQKKKSDIRNMDLCQTIKTWCDITNGLRVCRDETEREVFLSELLDRKTWKRARILSFANAHAANLAWENNFFAEDLVHSDYLVRDGIGIKLLMKVLKLEPGYNLNGSDFIPLLLESCPKQKRIAIYGTDEPWLTKGVERVKALGFREVTTAHGFYPEEWYVARAVKENPEVVLLAMGMPKQERVARLLREHLGTKDVLIINGGAIIDFFAGRFPRAPMWIRSIGLEWLYRLVREPSRMWRRYIIGNAKFLVRLVTVRLCY